MSGRLLYLDSSALVKLVADEAETSSLRRAVAGMAVASSELALTEVPRALRRTQHEDPGADLDRSLRRANALLRKLHPVPLDRRVLRLAGALAPALLRTLDAIHLVSAMLVADELTGFVSYDHRQLEAAREAGFPIASPGRPVLPAG